MASAEYELKRIADALEPIAKTLERMVEDRQPAYLGELLDYMNNPGALRSRADELDKARKKSPGARLGFPHRI
jgi:hypothetical protein